MARVEDILPFPGLEAFSPHHFGFLSCATEVVHFGRKQRESWYITYWFFLTFYYILEYSWLTMLC